MTDDEDSKGAAVVAAFGIALVFGTGIALVMGQTTLESGVFGLAVGIGFAIGFHFFYDPSKFVDES